MKSYLHLIFKVFISWNLIFTHHLAVAQEAGASGRSSSQQAGESSPEESVGGTSINVNAHIGQDKDGKTVAEVGSASVEGKPTTDPQFNPSNIRQLYMIDKENFIRNSQMQKEYMRTQNATAEWQKTIWGSQLKRFPMESFLFFVAIGAVNMATLMASYANNPLIMEQHLQSLTDPIGNLSFLAFMVANGYTTHFLDNPRLTVRFPKEIEKVLNVSLMYGPMLSPGATKEQIIAGAKPYFDSKAVSAAKKAYGHFLPYLSMTAGSMASHLVGDILHSLQACVKSITPPAGEQANKVSGKVKDPLNALSQDPCDVAWREWTIEKKYNTYAPALATMIVSQALSTAVSWGLEKAKTGAFDNGAAEGLSLLEAKGKKSLTFKFLGAALFDMNPYGMGGKAYRLIAHVSNLAMFTWLDQLVHHWVDDKISNINYGNYNIAYKSDAIPRKAEILYDLINKEKVDKYQKMSPACQKDIQSYECQSQDILGFLHNFSETMTKWRDFNKSKPLMAHQNWLQLVNNFQATEAATKSFYSEFLNDLQQTEFYRKNPTPIDPKASSRTAEENLEKIFADMENMPKDENGEIILDNTKLRNLPNSLNYIQFPLYGVEPILEEKEKFSFQWRNMYMDNPFLLEKQQMEKVKLIAKEFTTYIKSRGLDSAEPKKNADIVTRVLKGINSEKPNEIGHALNLMKFYSSERTAGATEVTQNIFKLYLDKLGNPSPLLYQGMGFSYAFENSDNRKGALKDMVLPHFFSNMGVASSFRFNKKTDYIYYHMLCGPEAESENIISKKYLDIFGIETSFKSGMQSHFIPPAIVKSNFKADLCSQFLKFKNSSMIYTERVKNTETGEVYGGIFPAIYKNLRPELQQIVDSKPIFVLESKVKVKNPFETWWEKNIEPKVIKKLDEFKEDYHEIAVELFQTYFKEDSSLSDGVVMNSVVYSTMQEARVYSMILEQIMKQTLAPEVYSKMVVKKAFNQKPFKIAYKQDIVSFQKGAYYQDFDAIEKGQVPKVLSFQEKIEEILMIYHNTVKAFQVEKATNSRGQSIEVINPKISEMDMSKLANRVDDLVKSIDADLDGVIKHLSQFNDKYAKAISAIVFIKLQLERLSKELTLNFEMVNLMTQKTTDYVKKELSEEEKNMKLERAKREKEMLKNKCDQLKAQGGPKMAGC